ncbi:MAG: efflux RND transporter periplasmic adaptor subunit [Megasphaera micronuciformis]|mgnify:FL=1|jgi:efflux transporter, RND family, MFP subunit|nr:efflux RND transporter periplasmic adaptor subunit [Megasphaera micronuciformis]
MKLNVQNLKKRPKLLIAVALVVICSIGAYAYYEHTASASKAGAVETAEVTRMNIKSSISATGVISPVNSVEVSPKITARISTVAVKENDRVEKGQVVATLDGKDYAAKKDQAQYKLTNAQLKYERAKALYEAGAGSKQDLDNAQFEYDTAASSLSEAESDVAETVITAPMSGVVVGEPKTPGTMAVQGNSSPTVIMRIADTGTKQIIAKVDETDIGKIKVGQDATFTVDSYTNKTFTAHVSKISQTDTTYSWDTTNTTSSSAASSASVIYYYVTLDVDDPNDDLRLGMTARVDISTSQKENALVVPIAALKTNNSGSYVVVVHDDGSTENVMVQTGIYSDDYVEITSGLSVGDKVSIAYTSSGKSSENNKQQGPPRL